MTDEEFKESNERLHIVFMKTKPHTTTEDLRRLFAEIKHEKS